MKTFCNFLFLHFLVLALLGCDQQMKNENTPSNDPPDKKITHVSNDTTNAAVSINGLDLNAFVEITEPQVNIDLEDIQKRGRLIALTGYSASSYFIYKGEPMGFEYDLLRLLAKHLNLKLEIVVVRNLDRIFSMLNEGKGDIVAYNMTVTKARLKKVDFTDQHTLIHQVLVQRLPENWRKMKRHQIKKKLIDNVTELIGKKVYVRKGSSYYQRLLHLSDEIGGDIDIVEVPGDVSTEELIAKVARGEIDYTVADENVAQINAAYLQNIDIHVPISLPQRIGWAIRKNSPHLKAAINQWLKEMKDKPTFNVLYSKYHLNKRFFTQRAKSEYFSLTGDKISPYDDLIKQQAKKLNWDWRLLASQVFQESQFDPKASSWVGARGLMQLMPQTAKQFGVKKVTDPVQNLKGGVKFIKWLENYWKDIPDSSERRKFVLASYNVGQGHVQDARKLAEKYGKDPNKWTGNVANFLLKKSQEKYFNDEVVKYGYCRGDEPVTYVEEILQRYRDYQKLIEA